MLQNQEASKMDDNLEKVYFDQLWDSRFSDCRMFSLIALILELFQNNIKILIPDMPTQPTKQSLKKLNEANPLKFNLHITELPGTDEIDLAQNIISFSILVMLLFSFAKCCKYRNLIIICSMLYVQFHYQIDFVQS